MKPVRILGVSGARPNFVKIDPVLRALERDPDTFAVRLVHTGQHYDDRMARVFFRELGIREPDVDLGVGSGTHAEQTGKVMIELERVLREDRPDLVLVVGDVNSTLAAAVTAAKLCIPVAHVEAGLRSFDRTMPEEINRVVTDALSDLLFTPSRDGDENLRREGIAEDRIHFVGNVMIDTLNRCLPLVRDRPVASELGLAPRSFGLLTLHRPSNVDEAGTFARIVSALARVQDRLPIVFPAHPRTVRRLDELGLREQIRRLDRLRIVEPLGYLDFLALQAQARVVLTDSGGIQEETTVLGVACVTLRENTERPVTIHDGTNTLTGTDPDRIVAAVEQALERPGRRVGVPELWDGQAAQRIADVLRQWHARSAGA